MQPEQGEDPLAVPLFPVPLFLLRRLGGSRHPGRIAAAAVRGAAAL
jgi:hypothetical protein